MAILAAVTGSVVAKNVAQMSVTDIEDAIQVRRLSDEHTEFLKWPWAMSSKS